MNTELANRYVRLANGNRTHAGALLEPEMVYTARKN
jgi:hypothetical protein